MFLSCFLYDFIRSWLLYFLTFCLFVSWFLSFFPVVSCFLYHFIRSWLLFFFIFLYFVGLFLDFLTFLTFVCLYLSFVTFFFYFIQSLISFILSFLLPFVCPSTLFLRFCVSQAQRVFSFIRALTETMFNSLLIDRGLCIHECVVLPLM